jgi:flagellin-specific chaperone FliS
MAIPRTSSVRLAIVLYDQLIQNVSRAADALAHRRPEQCATEIGHALAVIRYLRATLHQNGNRDVTRNSHGVYITLREKLIEAQVRSSRPILAQLRPQLIELRGAWIDLEGDG